MNKKRKIFNKLTLKSAIIEALLDKNIDACLKIQYRKYDNESDFYYDTACNIAEKIIKRYFEE